MNDPDTLFAAHGRVEVLDLDEAFLEHLVLRSTYRKHLVTAVEVLEVHSIAPRYYMNSGTGRAPVIMVGVTGNGRYVVVPIEPTGQVGVWRPVTAFEANRHHRDRYQRGQQ